MPVLSLSYEESDVTITIVSQSVPHIVSGNSWHRYDMKKLRHGDCHPMYTAFISARLESRDNGMR